MWHTDKLLIQFSESTKDVDVELQNIQLIETAARLLKTEIIENVTGIQEVYPSAEDLNKDDSFQYLPNSLRLLLTELFACKEKDKIRKKISAIGQALIQAARPRTVLTPLQLGLAVQMHHHFQSKYLIESLHALGFSASYKEVLKFERNAAMISGAKLDGRVDESITLKFSADNVDHDTFTLNGQDTFHGMGMMASISKGKFKTIEVPRNTVSDNELLKISQIEIIKYHQRKDLLQGLTLSLEINQLSLHRILIYCGNCPGILKILYQSGPVPCN